MYHFYVKHDRGYISDEVGDMQKIDMGIALYHFVRGLELEGIDVDINIHDPQIEIPSDVEYIATVRKLRMQ